MRTAETKTSTDETSVAKCLAHRPGLQRRNNEIIHSHGGSFLCVENAKAGGRVRLCEILLRSADDPPMAVWRQVAAECSNTRSAQDSLICRPAHPMGLRLSPRHGEQAINEKRI